jgi:pimeloyl-ACP methyl ester carboxylesterase
VIGYSFGGWVALWLAADKPACVDHLVLQSPLGFVPEGRDQLVGAAALAPARLHAHPERAAFADKPTDVARQNRQAVAGYAGGIDEPMSALADISCVTLLLAGADQIAPGHAALEQPDGLGRRHVVEVDQPRRFHGVVTDFLTWGEAFLVNRADQRTPFSRAADARYA